MRWVWQRLEPAISDPFRAFKATSSRVGPRIRIPFAPAKSLLRSRFGEVPGTVVRCANRDRVQLKLTTRPKRTRTAETASPPPKPTISGPFWTGNNSTPDLPKPQALRQSYLPPQRPSHGRPPRSSLHGAQATRRSASFFVSRKSFI